jgi:hypothetical protein
MPGHMDLISQLVDAGMRVQIGHTLGTYDEGVQALERGAKGFTHLFNAMSRFDHRAPGMVGARWPMLNIQKLFRICSMYILVRSKQRCGLFRICIVLLIRPLRPECRTGSICWVARSYTNVSVVCALRMARWLAVP